MDEESPPRKKEYPLSPSKMSKTPSWLMLGFVLGALFVVALPPLEKKPPPAPKTAEPAKPPGPPAPLQLTTIEAVFAAWEHLAVWSDDTTEVALWNSEQKAFTDLYEVRRIGGINYFRTIPRLTRRPITRGKPIPECPLVFTETEEQYREWREFGRSERPAAAELRPQAPGRSPAPGTRPGVEKTPAAATPPAIERPAFEPPRTGKPE